jgi:hypothetical protein
MKNDEKERFIEVVHKIDEINIVLAYKFENELTQLMRQTSFLFINLNEDDYQKEIFFNRKKRYALNLCVVCNNEKEITYMLTE